MVHFDIRSSVSHLLGCYKVACTGQLIIDQDRIPMGSNLTVHCQSSTVSCGRVFIMKFNQKEFLRKTSCSGVTAQVLVNEPKFSLYCLLEIQGKHHIICGRDIIANRMFGLFFNSLHHSCL